MRLSREFETSRIMTQPPEYLHLKPGTQPPAIAGLPPFRVVVIAELAVSPEWQTTVSDWLVKSGCLYMMAWGVNCSTWDDSVDMANIERFNFSPIPDDQFVLTTWHVDESMEDVFWYAKNLALHGSVEIGRSVLLHIAQCGRESEIMKDYEAA
jgi:hypothetical protein